MPDSNSRLIAKNTLLLYVRMLVLMLIALYTSRVILQALGAEDWANRDRNFLPIGIVY